MRNCLHDKFAICKMKGEKGTFESLSAEFETKERTARVPTEGVEDYNCAVSRQGQEFHKPDSK